MTKGVDKISFNNLSFAYTKPKGQGFKMAQIIKTSRLVDTGDYNYEEVEVSVRVPVGGEYQATTQCKDENYSVVITKGYGRNSYSVALFKRGEWECEFGKHFSDLSRQDAIANAAEWILTA